MPGRMRRRHSATPQYVNVSLARREHLDPRVRACSQHCSFRNLRRSTRDDDHTSGRCRWILDLAAAFAPCARATSRSPCATRSTINWRNSSAGLTGGRATSSCSMITSETLAEVVRRREQLAKQQVGPGKIIADLMLGAWVMLLSATAACRFLGRAIDYDESLAYRLCGSASPTGSFAKWPSATSAMPSPTCNLQQLLRNRAAPANPSSMASE